MSRLIRVRVGRLPDAASEVAHGVDINATNTGLTGAGYTYDAGLDTWTHPTYGPLTPSGSVTVSSHNQVIEGMDIKGRIHFPARYNDVAIRHCRIAYNANEGNIINGFDFPQRVRVEWCDITIDDGTVLEETTRATGGQWGNGMVLYRNKVTRSTSGFNFATGAQVIENFHFKEGSLPHGVHASGFSSFGGVSDQLIARNHVVLTWDGTYEGGEANEGDPGGVSGPMAYYTQFGTITTQTIEDNYSKSLGHLGGWYGGHGTQPDWNDQIEDIVVRGHIFSAESKWDDVSPFVSHQGPGVQLYDNQLEDGTPLSNQNYP